MVWGGTVDTSNADDLRRAIEGKDLVVSCCPYFCNEDIARAARELGNAYCDLAEDVKTGIAIEQLHVIIDQKAIVRYGINASQVLNTMRAMGGRFVGQVV